MYNEKWKTEYKEYRKSIGDSKARINIINRIFNDTSEYEKELKLDLAEMNIQQLLNCIMKFKTYTSAVEAKTVIDYYCLWATAKGYVVSDGLKGYPRMVINDMYVSTHDRYFISPEQMIQDVEKLRKHYMGDYIASYYLSIYEGIVDKKLENLINLRLKDIDKKNKEVHLHDGTTMKISSLLIELLESTFKTTSLNSDNSSNDGRNKVDLTESKYPDSIWKVNAGNYETALWSRLRKMMKIFRKELTKETSHETIADSGYYTRMMEVFHNNNKDIFALSDNYYGMTKKDDDEYAEFFENLPGSQIKNMTIRQFVKRFLSYLIQDKRKIK